MGRSGLDLQLVDNQSWVDEGTISRVSGPPGAEGVREGTRGGGTEEWKKSVTLGEETKGRGTGPKS